MTRRGATSWLITMRIFRRRVFARRISLCRNGRVILSARKSTVSGVAQDPARQRRCYGSPGFSLVVGLTRSSFEANNALIEQLLCGGCDVRRDLYCSLMASE